jgi:hypothetical protein
MELPVQSLRRFVLNEYAELADDSLVEGTSLPIVRNFVSVDKGREALVAWNLDSGGPSLLVSLVLPRWTSKEKIVHDAGGRGRRTAQRDRKVRSQSTLHVGLEVIRPSSSRSKHRPTTESDSFY